VGKPSLNAAQPHAKAEGKVFLPIPAYPGCPRTKAVKRLLLLLSANPITEALRHGTHFQGITQFYLPPMHLCMNGINHTCLYLPSQSWFSFSDPGKKQSNTHPWTQLISPSMNLSADHWGKNDLLKPWSGRLLYLPTKQAEYSLTCQLAEWCNG